jgi:aldehyde dehydrogenase (NAD+)
VITAFNFPVAVWAWNAALALVCGDSVIWKPSEKTPLCAYATLAIFQRAVRRFAAEGRTVPPDLCTLIVGLADVGEALAKHPAVPLVSATGSTRMGKVVAQTVAARLGKSLLELGGNNAMIVAPSADIDMAVRSVLFSAVGTAGQRCTTLRRLLIHDNVADKILPPLIKAYQSLRIGNPFTDGTLVGPLIDKAAVTAMDDALAAAVKQGGEILTGGGAYKDAGEGHYVVPAIVRMPKQTEIVKHETFAPILYVVTWSDFHEAITLQNDVPQGLSSCLFTRDVREAETFLSSVGSDCGIANINIGPSGAEIGGAFGGEKDTGGGRESGSDSWKAYMRRQTQTVNYSASLPLAQGVEFSL